MLDYSGDVSHDSVVIHKQAMDTHFISNDFSYGLGIDIQRKQLPKSNKLQIIQV